MARQGSTSIANRLSRAGAVITATPCTFAAWYKAITLPSTDANAGHAILTITDTARDDNFFGLFGREADDLFRFSAQKGGLPLRSAVSTTAITVGQWFHVCGVSASPTDRRIYIDGVDEGQSTVSTIPAGLDQTNMFVTRISSGFFSPANADLAKGGIWNVALTADEVAALASGVSPSEIRLLSLKAHYEFMFADNPEVDLSGSGNDLFVTGSLPLSDHPPVMPVGGVVTIYSAVTGRIRRIISDVAISANDLLATNPPGTGEVSHVGASVTQEELNLITGLTPTNDRYVAYLESDGVVDGILDTADPASGDSVQGHTLVAHAQAIMNWRRMLDSSWQRSVPEMDYDIEVQNNVITFCNSQAFIDQQTALGQTTAQIDAQRTDDIAAANAEITTLNTECDARMAPR